MAWTDEVADKDPFNYAPKGLKQTRELAWADGAASLDPGLRVGWQTGGRVGGTENAFNDEFFTRMYDQYDEEQQKIQDNPDYVSDLFLRPDFTGIVGWNQTFAKDGYFKGNAQLSEGDRQFKVGDVYDNGVFQGNVYDRDSGFTREEANAYVAPHIFGKDAADKYREADGDQDKLYEMIQEQGAKEGKLVEAYVTRAPYQQSVNKLLSDWEGGAWDEFLIPVAGFAGGAAAGAAFGWPGAIVGGIAGAVGSLANVDEARTMAAQAFVSTGLMAEEGTDAQIAHLTAKAGEFGVSRMNVLTNLTAGAVDVFSGNWGDDLSEIREAQAAGNWGADVALGVTGFVDGMLMSSNKAAVAAYTASMGGSALGNAYNKATNDGEWDEVTGSFHKYESMEQRLAAAGASAIDISQMLMPSLLRYSASRNVGGTKNSALDDLAPRNPDAVRTTTTMDRTFDVKMGADGVVRAERESLAQTITAWMVPSTAINRLAVRGSAYADVLRRGGSSVTADDLYQAAVRMERATVPWKLALVNGFGEATEEVLQTYLNGAATGWAAQPQELLNAAVAGFAMGAGMSVGSRVGTFSADERARYRANTLLLNDGQQPFSRTEWKAVDPATKRMLSTANQTTERRLRRQREDYMDDTTQQLVSSVVAAYQKEDALKTILKKQQLTPGEWEDALEDMADILPFNDVRMPSYMIFHSAKTTLAKLNNRLSALSQQLIEEDTDQQQDQNVQGVHDTLAGLMTELNGLYEEYVRTNGTDPLARINRLLQDYWDGTAQVDAPSILQQQAVELIFSRLPNDNPGSFQMLLPQIDFEMEANNAHGMSKVSQSFEKLLSHDNDGDKLKHMARYVPNRGAREQLRLGMNHWAPVEGVEEAGTRGGGFLNVAKRGYEDAILMLQQFTLAGFDVDAQKEVRNTYDALVKDLKQSLPGVRSSTFTNFRNMLEKNPDGAKQEFYRALALDYSKLISLGRSGTKPEYVKNNSLKPEQIVKPGTSIGIWIEDKIQQHLEVWRDAHATRETAEFVKSGTKGAQPQGLQAGTPSTVETAAATLGQTNEQRSGGSDPFRSMGGLQYGPINSVARDADGRHNPSELRQAIIEWYTNLTRLRPYSALTTLRQGGSPVVREARADLENLAYQKYPDLMKNPATRDETLIRLANSPFWNVDESQVDTFDFQVHDASATIGSVLIKAAAARQAALAPVAFGELDANEAYATVTPARAMQLLNGAVTPSTVLPKEQADQLGAFSSLDSLIRDYTMIQSRQQRSDWRARAELHSTYTELNAVGEPSLYRLLVDTIREASDKELSHAADGTAQGRLAREDKTFHEKHVLPIFQNLAHMMDTLGLRGLSRQGIINTLENNSRVLQNVLSMFPAEMQLAILKAPNPKASPRDFAIPGWFFDMLLEENAEKAAFIYWDAMLQMDLDMYGKDAHPGNAWVQLYSTLDAAGKQTLDDMRATATSVQQFVDEVNREITFNQAPLLAWRTDTTLYSPDSTKSGWQWSAPSAERRQAIRDAAKYFKENAQALPSEVELQARNLGYATDLLNALQKPDTYKSAQLSDAIKALDNRLKQSGVLRQPTMGPRGRRAFVERSFRGIDPGSASKGVASPGIAQYGDTDVRRDQTAFGSQLDQTFSALLAGDAKSISFNPQALMQELRLQTESGAIIDWTPLTTEQFLQLFIMEDGAYQNLLFALINPSVYEETGPGKAVQQYLFPQDLEKIVGTTFYKDLINGTGGRNKHETNELFLSYVDSLTNGNLVTRMLADSAIARTTTIETLTNSAYESIVADVAEAIRSLMGLAPGQGDALRGLLETQALKDYEPIPGLGQLGALPAPAREAQIDNMIQLYQGALDVAVKNWEANKTIDNADLVYEASEKLGIAQGLKNTRKYGELQMNALKIDWDSPTAQRVTKTMITQYIETFGPSLATTMTGDDAKTLSKWNLAQTDHMDIFKSFSTDEAADRKVWDELSKIVALHRTLTKSGYLASDSIASPTTKEWGQFDPTFVYLTKDMVSDEFLSVLSNLRKAVPDAMPPRKSVDAVVTDLNKTVLRPKNFGKWVPDLVMQHSGSSRYLDSSGSPQQIAIGGELLKSMIAATISARRTNTHPTPDMARAYKIDAEELIASETDFFGRGLQGEPWAMLEGASVVAPRYNSETGKTEGAGPVLIARDTAGNVIKEIPLTLATSRITNGGKDLEGVPGTIAQITHQSMIEAVKTAMSTFKGSAVAGSYSSISVEFQMFNPVMKPAMDPSKPADKQVNWANNIHFDGTLGQTDTSTSIYAALLAGVDGLVQRLERAALDAIKGSLAIFTTAHPRGFDGKDPNQLLDLLYDITADVMRTPMGEDYLFPNNAYKGVFRLVRDRLLVTGQDAEGNKVTLSSEQALTTDLSQYTDLKVVELSTRSLETLRGATGGSGHPRNLQKAPRIGGEGEPWKGYYEPFQLERMPQLGTQLTDLNQIAEALRTSGLLDRDRVQTFQYGTHTADERTQQHRKFEEFIEERSAIAKARRERGTQKRYRSVNTGVAIAWRNLLRQDQRVRRATTDALQEDLGGVKPNRDLTIQDAHRSLSNILSYANGNEARLFLVDPSDLQANGDEGRLTSVRKDQGERWSNVRPVNDIVILQLDGYEEAPGTPEWNRLVVDELAAMKERGLTIGLTSAKDPNAASMARDLLLQSQGPYESVNDDLFIFAPVTRVDEGRTLAARRATLTEAKVQSLRGYVLAAYSEDGFYATDAEGVQIDPLSKWLGYTQGYASDIVPTTGMNQYHSPGTPQAGQRIAQVYDYLLKNNGALYLMEQQAMGGGGDTTLEEFQTLLQRAYDNLDRATGRPKVNTEFRPGDLVATINEIGSLTFTRWGYDSTDVDFESQDRNGLDGISIEGIPSTKSIRLVAGKKLPHDKASLRGGTIEQVFIDPVFGLRILFKNDINLYGAKMVDEHGTKTRSVILAENKLPSVPMFNDTRPAMYADYPTTIKKGVNAQGTVLNAREGIFVYGMDFHRTLANALWYGTPGTPYYDVDTWAALDPDERAGISARVVNALELARLKETERISDNEDLAFSVYKSNQLSETARALIEEQGGATLGSAQLRAKYAAAGVNVDELQVEQLYLSAALQYLKGNGTSVYHVLGSPGFEQDANIEDRESLKMPAILTQFIDMNLPLRKYVIGDVNARMSSNEYDPLDGSLVQGWLVQSDWRVLLRRANGTSNTVVLRSVRAEATGEDHSERSELNSDLATHDVASNQQQMFARETIGLDLGYARRDPKLSRLLEATAYSEERVRDLTFGRAAERLAGRSSEEQSYRDENSSKARGYLTPITRELGTVADEKVVDRMYDEAYKHLGLVKSGTAKRMVDSMIRMYYRAVSDPNNPEVDKRNAAQMKEALASINASLAAYRWPMDSSAMPLMHGDVVDYIARNGTWTPENVTVTGDKRAFMLQNALDNTMASAQEVPVEAQREIDALFATYEKYFSKGFWPASAYPAVIERLASAGDGTFVSSIDPYRQMQLEGGDPYAEYDGIAPDSAYVGTTGAGTKLESSRRAWRTRERTKDRGGDQPTNMLTRANQGAQYRDKVNYVAGFWRNAHALRTITPQLNPWLWIWNPIDFQWRRMPAAMQQAVSGQGVNWAGQRIRDGVQFLADKTESSLLTMDPESRKAAALQAWTDAFGVTQPWITPEANAFLKETVDTMMANQDFRSALAEESRHHPDDELLTRGDRQRQKAVDWASRSQDLLRGLASRAQVEAYLVALMENERINNPNVTAMQILERLHRNPLAFKQMGPFDSHTKGVRTVQNFKGAKLTAIGALVDRILIPMSESPNAILSGPANTLLLMAKFRNFAFSSAVQMMGGQAVDAAATILMQAVAFRKQAYRRARGLEPETPNDYISRTMESADMADLFIRSGMSLTGLFFAGLAFNAAGLTGETEEERRKRRIELLQGLGTLYDPRDIANSFLNENAVWLEGLANGPLAPLAAWFRVETGEGQPMRSPAQMHWTLNFFVSPIMGVAEFMQTGDFSDLADGFFGAIGSMPLINTNMFWDAWTTTEKMYAAASEEAPVDVQQGSQVTGQLIKVAATLEKMLLEFAFVNELAAASDEYMRDPWTMPAVNESGQLDRTADGQPRQTDVTDEQRDEEGFVYEDEIQRPYNEGLWRYYTGSQQTLAFLSSLVTGFTSNNTAQSFWRQDQVVDGTTIKREGLDMETAEAVIMSVYNEDTGQEVLTTEGMIRLFDSLHAGTAKATDPALQNIFITGDQRAELSDIIQKKIYVEGVETLGLSEDDAMQRMYDIWNGPKNNPYVTPLWQVVWSQGEFQNENGLPFNETVRYNQLNTTWAVGPDGKMWATGVARHSVPGLAGGVLPLTGYQGSGAGGLQGNLGVDEVLNSTDDVMGVNTGYRMLTRVNNNLEIPNEEDIIKAIEDSTKRVVDEIKNLDSDLYNNLDRYRGGYRYGSGGGGYGGGGGSNPYMPFLNGMRTPYADNIPNLYINNINPRRASVRRERFSSERGRLNQQQ